MTGINRDRHRPTLNLGGATLLALGLAGCAGGAAEEAPTGFEAHLERALSFAAEHPGALDAFADGRHDADDIKAGRIEAPVDGQAISAALLEIIEPAESFGEAILLARVAGQAIGAAIPPVPATLADDPEDADWEFAGRNVTLPYAVQTALDARRAARDEAFETLAVEDREALMAVESAAQLWRRQRVAEALGWRFDPREDLYVVDGADGNIWRRKLPDGYVRSLVTEEPSSMPIDPEVVPPELPANWVPGQSPSFELIGSDNRELRSLQNGYSMGGAAWEPKGAIVDDGRTTQEVPVEVDCTGVKIRERLVATAGHCMYSDGAWNDNTKWIPGADGINAVINGGDPSPNGYKTRYARVVRGNWFDHEWSDYDFGVFVLYDNSSSCGLHWHGWRSNSMLSMLGKSIYLYGFPGERRDCAASPASNGWCYGSIYGKGGSVAVATAYRAYYSIDTQPGQSGTGYYEIDGGDRYVVGAHRGFSGTYNDGTFITSGNRDLINDAKADYPANACN
ncbi:MAG: hypothetical protein H6730_27535 [Deltaproteobacteria bacterium]|nr:hypothetical protein [Deltaproteobacteria bacterium]